MSNEQVNGLKTPSLKSVKNKLPIAHIILIILLILAIAIGGVPSYLSGKWSWADIPQVANIQALRNIKKNGLTLAGWKTVYQKEIMLGGNQWSLQMMTQGEEAPAPVTLLLMPQDYYKNKPEVEWTDVNALEHWKTDSHTLLKFTTQNPLGKSSSITARFFRAWKRTTVAVVQWYAWPGGGHFSSSRWFWLDQWAQLHQQRIPWIAVCLQIPINPLSSLKANEQFAVSLAQSVQKALEENIFQAPLIEPGKTPSEKP